MRTRVVLGMIAAAHCLVVGSVLLIQGCGRTAMPPAEPGDIVTPMPPREVSVTPPVFRPPVDETASGGMTAPEAAVEMQTYKVVKGDTISLIAQKHGIRQKEILELNSLKNPNVIRVGQELNLPAHAKLGSGSPGRSAAHAAAISAPDGMRVYTVEKGDCLSVLASRFGSSVKSLREANKLSSDLLKIGQKLVVPSGAGVAPKPQTRPSTFTPIDESAVEPPEGPTETGMEPPMPLSSTSSDMGARPPIVHEVEAGEDLDSVANLYAVPVEKLMAENGLTSKRVSPGMVLKIPQGN